MGDWAVVPASDWSVVHEPVDMGPEARHARGGMRPEPKSDAELGIDEGAQFPTDILGRKTEARNNPGTVAYQASHAGDEMNDPGAQMLTAGALAAPLAVVAGAAAPAALAPLVSGAASGGQQAAMMGQNPLVGAALGALPGVGPAARAADSTIGAAALRNVAPAAGPGKIAQFAGKWIGAGAGHAVGGLPGAAAGHYFGGKAAVAAAAAADNVTNALAERYLNQQADATLAGRGLVHFGDVPAPPVGSPTSAPMVNLSPLAHQPLPEATMVPNGALGTPFVDDFGVPVTKAGQGGSVPGEAATNAGGKVLPPSLRDDVVRSSKAFRDDPYDTDAPATPDIEDQLARSVRMFGQLKSAKAAGKLTPADIQDAVKAGMSPIAVAKVVGQDVFDSAMGK